MTQTLYAISLFANYKFTRQSDCYVTKILALSVFKAFHITLIGVTRIVLLSFVLLQLRFHVTFLPLFPVY